MKLFLKKDIIVILLFLLAALLLFFAFRGVGGKWYEISVSGEITIKESLFKNAVHELENGVVIVCEKGEVFFKSSDCRDKICCNAGHLSRTGEWAACLPNEIFLKIVEEAG